MSLIYIGLLLQSQFLTATEIAVDCANIQSEIAGVQNRIKYIQRIKNKKEKFNERIENLDSQFSSNLAIGQPSEE